MGSTTRAAEAFVSACWLAVMLRDAWPRDLVCSDS